MCAVYVFFAIIAMGIVAGLALNVWDDAREVELCEEEENSKGSATEG